MCHMKNKTEYIRTKVLDTKKASRSEMSEKRAESIRMFKIRVLYLLYLANLINTLESVSNTIIIKNISVCQNSKNADVVSGSIY